MIKGIGIDTVEVKRFAKLKGGAKNVFLKKVFTEFELKYSLKDERSALHLAGIFAAKEAASKALGTGMYPFIELEVRYGNEGKPEVWKNGRKLKVLISITHTESLASAIALAV